MSTQNGLVQRLWSYCNILRDDGLSYGDYLEQHVLTELGRRLRAAIERAQRRSASLRRAILERAFRGDLVAQGPSDEPAAVLLEGIRSERDNQTQARPRARRRLAPGPGWMTQARCHCHARSRRSTQHSLRPAARLSGFFGFWSLLAINASAGGGVRCL